PDLHRPPENAVMIVDPVVENAGDDLLWVIFEIVEDRNSRIPCDLRAFLSKLFISPKVFRRERIVVLSTVWPQEHAAVCVERNAARDVRVLGDKIYDSPHFRLARRVGTGAVLVRFLPPVGGEIAVQIQTLFVWLDIDGHAIPILKRSFWELPIVSSARFSGISADQQSWLFGMGFPRSIRIGNPHLQESAVSVDILSLQPFQRIFVVRVWPCAG